MPPSEEQARVIAAARRGDNVVVPAQAGAGKTTTMLAMLSAGVGAGGRRAIVSFNKQLQLETTAKLAAAGLADVECFTVHSLAAALLGVAVPDTLTLVRELASGSPTGEPFALVCVDEAQDVGPIMIDALRLVERLGPGVQWVVVGDLRQEIYTFTGTRGQSLMDDPEGALGPGDRGWSRCPLNQTYRMTPAIVAALNANYRGPADPPLAAVRAAAVDDPAPRHVVAGADRLVAVVLEVLAHHAVEEVAVLAPSVRTDLHGVLSLAEGLVERGVRVHSTHAQDATLSPAVLAGKLFVSTYHQAKGREWDAVVVLGADARLAPEEGAMHPPLHVALTRARSRLVVVTAPSQPLYPTATPALRGFEAPAPAPAPARRPAKPAGEAGWLKEYRLRWAIDFAADAVLRRAAACLRVQRLAADAAPAPGVPPATVSIGATAESVLQYYPQAVLARASAVAGAVDPWHVAPLREAGRRRARMAGPLLFAAQHALHRESITAREWVMITSVGAAIRTGIRHPLKQLPESFDWVDEGYIEAEAAGLVAALQAAGDPVFGQSFERDSLRHRVSLCCVVPIVTSASLDGRQLPWRYSSAEAPTELDLLVSAVSMWLVGSTVARVYCRGVVYSVTVGSAEERDALVGLCFDHKRR